MYWAITVPKEDLHCILVLILCRNSNRLSGGLSSDDCKDHSIWFKSFSNIIWMGAFPPWRRPLCSVVILESVEAPGSNSKEASTTSIHHSYVITILTPSKNIVNIGWGPWFVKMLFITVCPSGSKIASRMSWVRRGQVKSGLSHCHCKFWALPLLKLKVW